MEQIVRKPVRTMSGVTPLTVVLKPRKCDHGTCIYCPGGETVPQSYTNKSPAIMRALALSFDPYTQVMNRLNVLNKMGHPTELASGTSRGFRIAKGRNKTDPISNAITE